jgi:hypothetical protein
LTLYFSIGVCFLRILTLVAFYHFDVDGCDCANCSFAQFLCVVCSWRDFKFKIRREDCV